MPTAITGDSASFNTGATVALTGPADGEGIDAADLNVPLETLADGVEHYRTYGDRLNAAQTITAAKTHDLADENSAALLSVEPATRVFWMTLPLTGTTGAANIYHAEGLELAQNATWANGTALWTQTDVGLDSWMIRFNAASGVIQFLRKAAGAGPTWADGAWTVAGYVGAGGLTGIGVTSSSGDITSANDVGANRDVNASRHVTALAGNVTATGGNVTATGTPVGDAGPGLLKGKRHYSTGAALVAGDISVGGGWGATTAPTLITNSNDGALQFTLVAAGGGYAADPVWTLTFKDGTFTRTPVAIVVMSNTTDATAYIWNVTYTASATQIVCTMRTNAVVPTAAASYTFSVIVVGV